MQLNLNDEAMATIASAAIFDQISQESRENLLKQAIKALLTPEGGPYSYSPKATPLQNAFNTAIQQAAFKAVQEKIQNDPQVQAKIDELLGPLILPALEGEAENYDSTLADALGNALGSYLAQAARDRRDR